MRKRWCIVEACNKSAKADQMYFGFPKDPDAQRIWLQRLGLEGVYNGKDSRYLMVCGNHFSAQMRSASGKRRLTQTAIPDLVQKETGKPNVIVQTDSTIPTSSASLKSLATNRTTPAIPTYVLDEDTTSSLDAASKTHSRTGFLSANKKPSATSNQDVPIEIDEDAYIECITTTGCRDKWNILRNSYARYIRNKQNASGSEADNSTKWYLADNMSFLKDFVKPRKQPSFTENYSAEDAIFQQEFESYQMPSSEPERPIKHFVPGTSLFPQTKSKRRKQSTSDQIVGPMIEYLRIKTKEKRVTEHPFLIYTKGLLPDFDQLTPRRQRLFKEKTLSILNSLLDEQDTDVTSAARTPGSSFSGR